MAVTNSAVSSLLNATFAALIATPTISSQIVLPLPIPSWLNTTFVPFDPEPTLDSNVTTSSTRFMICAVVKDEDLYIDEWLEYHRFLGFDYVMLHDNADNRSEYLLNLPQKYPEYVTIHHGPGIHQQETNYKKCLDTFRNTSMWAAFIDVDEFLVLHKHKTVREYVLDVAPHGSSISLLRSQYTANHLEQYAPYPVLSRFLSRHITPDHRVKSLAYLPHVNRTITHHMGLFGNLSILDAAGKVVEAKRLLGNGIANGSTEVATFNHYFTKSFGEFQKKRLRGLAGHSERSILYQGDAGMRRTCKEFVHSENKATVIDTYAWDFYRAKKSEQLGHAYGEDFPIRLNISEHRWYCNITLCWVGPPVPNVRSRVTIYQPASPANIQNTTQQEVRATTQPRPHDHSWLAKAQTYLRRAIG